jgi:hypothetical protein
MQQDHNILIFDYDFDQITLLDEFNKHLNKFESYTDPRGTLDNFQVARQIEFTYADELCHLFNINARPRFYIVKAFSTLPQHQDHGTQCSINVLLNSTNPAPIQFGDTEYYYKQALLNTQNTHGVVTNSEDRLLFKLSVFDESFASVAEKIKKVLA